MWIKPLENGDLALALFNRGETIATVRAIWELIGLQGKHKVRDLWAQADLGSFRDFYSADVAAHGVVMLRIAR
jgi:alpha-galactosidase